MSNRVPEANSKCCACLVSLEERSDLVPKNPPPDYAPPRFIEGAFEQTVSAAPPVSAAANFTVGRIGLGTIIPEPVISFQRTVKLVLLFSWRFECIGPGSFRDLMQGLYGGMFGTVPNPGHPPVTDTGHITINLGDRAGVEETVLYRSPLTPFQLTRDPLGPYHSADQCRRVTPETGAEDVSYACAFEAGRLLAAADARLAQELMRWRREAYKQSARADTFRAVSAAVPLAEALDVHTPAIPVVAAGATASMISGRGLASDPYGIQFLNHVIGLNPVAVQDAWQLSSVADAVATIGGDPGTLGATVVAPASTPRPATTLAQVAADTSALANLAGARDKLIANTTQFLGGKP
jgi:hypothetical protein